ncbi:MAG: hypothetical protein E6J29_11430 [Chloroflexi bacterium]|nr:MAG: hypothetical protein E6J29_11430 [Chloroflexota bacterium]TMD54864.1 MAG: hypothetical protein E6I85_05150 [Chloroflexota bacterium]
MVLDTLGSRERQVALLERYGGLLTDHQRLTLELYLGSDWSLAEIASKQKVSRSAVHDLVRRSVQLLEDSERRLGLLAEGQERARNREAIAAELADLRRRMARLEARLDGV